MLELNEDAGADYPLVEALTIRDRQCSRPPPTGNAGEPVTSFTTNYPRYETELFVGVCTCFWVVVSVFVFAATHP